MENAFGRLMAALRQAEGLTVTEAARRLGKSGSYVFGWEKGTKNPPSLKVLGLVHQVYAKRVTLENLVELAWIEKAPALIRERLRAKCRNPLYEITMTPQKIRIPKRA